MTIAVDMGRKATKTNKSNEIHQHHVTKQIILPQKSFINAKLHHSDS